MKINGQSISSPGKKIKVGPPVQVRSTDPFRNFFDRDPSNDFNKGTTEFVDVKEDTQLMDIDKNNYLVSSNIEIGM